MTPPPIRSILAATDLGAMSRTVVRSAAALAARLGAELHLLHVFDLEVLRGRAPDAPVNFPDRIRQAQEALALHAREDAPGLRPASLEVVNYAPGRAIIDRAEQVGAQLTVIGAHPRQTLRARLLGTTVDEVLRSSIVPCMVVPDEFAVPLRALSVATDLSTPARRALELALAVAPALGDVNSGAAPEIRVVHVGWDVERTGVPKLGAQQLRPAVQREIEAVRAAVPGAAGLRVIPEVLWEVSPAAAITRSARDSGAELLVMGSHGRSGMARLLVGSVAAGVVREVHCPCIVVPAP